MIDRRAFFLGAGATAAASSAETKIRAAIIGTGHAHATGKLKTLLDLPDLYDFAGVAEPDPEARRRFQDVPAYRNVRWLSPEEVLEDPTLQVVAVETQVWDLMGWGRKVIAAGKHLHIDKPPGPDMQPFKELVEEARRKRLLLQTGYIWRFHQGMRAAFEAARQGWLGHVYMVRGVINTDIGADQRASVGRYPSGMMFELGCHMIDRVVDLLGRPRQVRHWLRHDTPAPDRLADNTLAVFEYDQALAIISSAARMPGASAHRSFELTGTEGAIVIQPVEPGNRMQISLREARGPYRAGWQEVSLPNQIRYLDDLRALARAVRTGQPLEFSYDHELLVQETLLRACGQLA